MGLYNYMQYHACARPDPAFCRKLPVGSLVMTVFMAFFISLPGSTWRVERCPASLMTNMVSSLNE